MDAAVPDLTVGVVGAGTMGRGIAQVALAAGCRVVLTDARPEAADAARDGLAETFGRLAAKGRMTPQAAEQAAGRLHLATEPGSSFAGCAVVVEAIAEDLEAKRRLFARLEEAVPASCVLATNTSSLSVSAVAAATLHPDRVAGFHFFNPVPLMRLVEVVAGCRTAPATVAFLRDLADRFGHLPVSVADTPGFVVNHAGRGFGPEALRIAAEGVAAPAEIDRILTEQAGFRMGPFELFDLVGLDVSAAVMGSLFDQFFAEPRFRPSHLVAPRVAAGLLGRKTGRGFYEYHDGRIVRPPEPPTEPPAPDSPARPVWISRAGGAQSLRLAAILAAAGVEVETGPRPGRGSLCLVLPLGADATAAALAERLDPERTLAVDPLLELDRRRVAMATPVTRPDMRAAARRALGCDGTPVSVIADSPGFVSQRVLAMIVNVACDIAQQRVAAPTDIDAAVTRGLGYPRGPLEWGDWLGPGRVLEVLTTLYALTGEPRWRPSPWLRRRAQLGVSLLTPEGQP